MGYRTIAVTPVTGVLGAQVDGLDLRQPLSEQQQIEVRDALTKHLVLFFRGQDLSEEQQLAFASTFGPPVTSSINKHDDPSELMFVTLEDSADSPPSADRWHTDVVFKPTPPDVAVLNMRVAPPYGGDTMWISLYEVFERLSPTMQELLTGLEIDLDLGPIAEIIRQRSGDQYIDEIMAEFGQVRHPLVRVHPVSGRRALFVSIPNMRGIIGMHPDESAVLLRLLEQKLNDPNVQLRWHWQQYDVAVWDERCTNHRALGDHYPARRVVRRCLAGEGVPLAAAAH